MGLQVAIKLNLSYQEGYNVGRTGGYWYKATNNTN